MFWLSVLWVSCCRSCHSGFKQSVERRGPAAIDALALRLGLPTLTEARGGGGRSLELSGSETGCPPKRTKSQYPGTFFG